MACTSEHTGPELRTGDIIESLEVVDLTVDGGGLARHHGQVIFLDGGLPGAQVNARICSVGKRSARALIQKTLRESPDVVEPWCPHATVCGACSWQHFAYPAALAWKEKHVRETLSRIGKVSVPVERIEPSPSLRGYRNKMVYAFAPAPGGTCLLGLRQSGGSGKDIVEVSNCGMQNPLAMRILAHVREGAGRYALAPWRKMPRESGRGTEGYLRFLVIHTPLHSPGGRAQVLVECITGASKHKDDADKVLAIGTELSEVYGISGFIHSERIAMGDVAQGERVVASLGATEFEECIGDITLAVPYDAFLQTNSAAAATLYAAVANEAGLRGTEVVWDLYCGVGGIGLFLAGRASEVHGFEVQASAVDAARKNSAKNALGHCSFYKSDLSFSQTAQAPSPDVIIVDPPRAGMHESVVSLLRKNSAQRLLYVSCDVATQARDLQRLAPVWRPVRSLPVDMFPYTPHVENLLVFERS